MGERLHMQKEVTKKEDGRYLIYYHFDGGETTSEELEGLADIHDACACDPCQANATLDEPWASVQIRSVNSPQITSDDEKSGQMDTGGHDRQAEHLAEGGGM